MASVTYRELERRFCRQRHSLAQKNYDRVFHGVLAQLVERLDGIEEVTRNLFDRWGAERNGYERSSKAGAKAFALDKSRGLQFI